MIRKTGGTVLSLDRYAELAAVIGQFGPERRAEVLARMGVHFGDYEVTVEKWTEAFDAELAHAKTGLSLRFTLALSRAWDRLRTERPSLDSLGPLPRAADLDPAPPALEAQAPAISGSECPAPPIHVLQAPNTRPFDAPCLVSGPRALPNTLHDSVQVVGKGAGLLVETAGPPMEPPPSALPFRARGHDPTEAERAMVFEAPRPTPAGFLGETALAPTSSSVPSLPPLPPGTPALTLEQYTSLRVELSVFNDRIPAVLTRYGVTPSGREALDAHWRVRFAEDPGSRLLFARAYAQYIAWLRANGAVKP